MRDSRPSLSSSFPATLLLGTALFCTASFCTAPRALAQEATAPLTPRAVTSWTTYKGDAQRTGSSAADIKLPLSLQWRFSSEAPARTYQVSPLVIGSIGRQTVVFGAGKNVYGLDFQTGEQKWKSPDFTSNVVTPVTLLSGDAGDLIIVGQQGGRLAALRASDGGRVWEVDALSSISDAGPIIVNTNLGQRIIVAVNAGRLLAFNLDGTLDKNWEVALGRYNISPTSSMALSSDGSLIFICASDSKLYAIDARKGALAYSLSLAANSSVTPVVAGDQVIASNVRLVSAYKALGGSAAWSFDPRGEIIGSPSVGRDATGKTIIYFGTRTGTFYAIDNTGAQVWKADVGEGFTGSPLVLPSMIVCGTNNGLLIGLDPTNGTTIWQYRLKTERITLSQAAGATGRGTGGRGGGRRFGRRGGAGGRGGGAIQNRIWGVSSSPAAVGNQLLLLGDNAALYSFTTNSFDAAPPRVVDPSLSVPDEANQITSLALTGANLQIPGRGPIYFAAQLDDTGSGIDSKSIKVSLDDAPLAATAVDFRVESGILTVTLLDPKAGGTGLADGLKSVIVSAKDYAGNTLQYGFSFLVDNTASAPRAQRDNGPGGGEPGGGEPGGDPNGEAGGEAGGEPDGGPGAGAGDDGGGEQ